jgi:putative hydrolase of the HAD superfamily
MTPGTDPAGAGDRRAVLFDLDDTLFDHAHATRHALSAVARAEAALARWTPDELFARHSLVLETLHRRVLAGEIDVDAARLERFATLIAQAGGADAGARAAAITPVYREAYEAGWRAVPGAIELVGAVHAAGAAIVIVTNNGVAEQRRKIRRLGIESLVCALVTSEETGSIKPDAAIFRTALDCGAATADRAVMLGDSWEADVAGALAAGIRPVWFNRHGLPVRDSRVESIGALEPAGSVLGLLLG